MNASLVSIHTKSESDYITDRIESFGDVKHVWLGGNDEKEEGIWM